ncbi:MAG: glycosyltransferase [Clostridia bacterium]
MKVLMVSKACVTASYRGKLFEMVSQDSGLELTLVVPPQWGSLPYEAVADEPFRTRILPVRLSGRNHFHWYPGMGQVLQEEKPDLVHVDEEHYSLVTGLLFRETRRRRIPALFFTWQNILKRYPLPFARTEQFVFRHAAGAIAGNQEAGDVLRQKGYGGPLAVIPQFGCDPDVFRPRAHSQTRSAWGLAEGEVTVGYVGRLVPEKGLDTLLEAMIPILRVRPRTRLILAGSGPLQEYLSTQIETAGLAAQVRLVPWTPSHQMPDLMNALDILVLPSKTTPTWKEQFGRVLPEAMASEVAVVGSTSGEIPRVIGDAGRVFEEGNARELRDVLEALLSDPVERHRLARRGRVRVRERFTQSAIATDTLSFYRSILA